MKEKNERKVLSKKQISSKLFDSFFGWGILFGLAVGIIKGFIDESLKNAIEGIGYSIITSIIALVGYAVQWMFTARIAVKNTFKKFTVNKDQSKGILNKSIIFFSVLNLIVSVLAIYSIIAANKELALLGADVNITLPIILQAIVGVGSIGIIIYMTNTQKAYIETQCVENMPEEKLKMSIAEKVLLIIIGVIVVVTIVWAIKVGVIDRQVMKNDDEETIDYNNVEDLYNKQQELVKDAEETAKKSNIAEAKSLVALVYSENLFIQQDDGYIKTSVEDLEKLINDELLKEFGPEYTVTLSEEYGVTYNFETEVKEESKAENQKDTVLNKDKEVKREELDINGELVQKLHGYIPSQHYYSDNNLTAYQNKLVTMDNFENAYLLTCTFFNENTVVDKIESDDPNFMIEYRFKPESFQDDVKRIYGKELKNESFGLPMERCDYENGLYSYISGGGSVVDYYNLTNIYNAYKAGNELIIEDTYILGEYYYDDSAENWVIDLYNSSERTTKITTVSDVVETDEEVENRLNSYKTKYENRSQKYKHTFKLSEEGTYYWYSTEPVLS